MELDYSIYKPKRKQMAATIALALGEKVHYNGIPTYSYSIGDVMIDRDGKIILPTNLKETIVKALKASNFECMGQSDEGGTETLENERSGQLALNGQNLTVSLPLTMFDGDSLTRLKKLVASKEELFQKAFAVEGNIEINVDEEQINFPWFKIESSEETKAYTLFIEKIAEMAIKQQRINSITKETENDKYAFRCFLLRLGFIGNEYKEIRKILLKNLSGSSAFKNGYRRGDEHE